MGCVALIAIILLFVFRKKVMAFFKKDSPAEDEAPAWSAGSLPPQTQPSSQTGSAFPVSEMSSDYNSVQEIGSSQQTATRPAVVHELS